MNGRQRREAKRAKREAAVNTTVEQPAVGSEQQEGKVIDMKKAQAKAKARKSAGGGKKSALSVKTLPPLPKKAGLRRAKPEVDCECGCGGKTKSRFMPGHDSYLRGLVIRVDRDVMTLADVEKLGGKGQRTAVEKHLALYRKAQKTGIGAAPKASEKKAEAKAAKEKKQKVATVEAAVEQAAPAATGTEGNEA